MASKWKAVKLASEETETKQLIPSCDSDDNVNWSSADEIDSEKV